MKRTLLENEYSLEATYYFGPVLAEAKWLGWEGDYRFLYQQTPSILSIKPRHWVVGVHVKEDTDKKIIIEWKLVDNYIPGATRPDGTQEPGKFTGRWTNKEIEEMIGKPLPTDAIWVPYSTGSWELDLVENTITYTTKADPGGDLGNLNLNGAVVAFPNHIAKKMGLQGRFKVVS